MKQHISAEQKIDPKKAMQAFKQLREIFQQQYPNGLTDKEIEQILEEKRNKKYLRVQKKH